MQVTRLNYKEMLPETLWDKFASMANSYRGKVTPIFYENGALRYASANE